MLNGNQKSWKSIQELFHLQSQRTPDIIAVSDGSIEKTYYELDKESDSISRAIQAIGITKNELVALLMEPSYDYIVTTLGILKSGAAFLPISTDLPEENILAILRDSCPRLLLTDQKQFIRVPADTSITKILITDMVDPLTWGDWTGTNIIPTRETDAAFATYTSGTTGEPKGVLQTQVAMVTSYESRHEFHPYRQDERVACNIFFMWEFLRPLLRGATCYVIPDSAIYTPRKLANFLAVNKITEVLVTPSVLQALVATSKGTSTKYSLQSLRTIWLNGEVVTNELIQQAKSHFPDHLQILNTYSICECHDVANYDTNWATPDVPGPLPVGYPSQGVIAMVVPIGTSTPLSEGIGELYIGGSGLATGYLGQPKLTEEKFVSIGNTRFYATGDLAEIREDKLILVYGRCDSMVKIRGYSVSLGAIEQALRTHCAVSEAIVLANGDHLAQHLTAYVIRDKDSWWSIDTLSSYSHDLRMLLSDHLPAHMIPTKYIEIETIPINPVTGKADHKVLVALDIPRKSDIDLIDAKSDSLETLLRQLWAHSLEIDQAAITPTSNFFDLGGHSLSAVTLMLDIEEFLGTELEGTEVYDHPIFEDFLANLSSEQNHVAKNYDSLRYWEDANIPLNDFLTLPTESNDQHGPNGNVPPTVLITGATGFLGSYLLDSIVNRFDPDTKIYCLVRHAPLLTPYDRLQNAARSLGINSFSVAADRIIAVEGDIEKPYLGLAKSLYKKLSHDVTTIFHCAANVNLQYSYDQLRNSIVMGTREVLNFATYRTVKSLHYVSSNAVFPDIPGRLYTDNTDISSFGSTLRGGYNQAKWVADRLTQRARDARVPINIYRPGNIGPTTNTGSFNHKDLQTLIIKACMMLGVAPSESSWKFEMTPVDIVADTIVQAALSENYNKNYNIVQETPIDSYLIFSRLASLGYIRGFIPVDEWFAKVAVRGKTLVDKDLIITGSAKLMATHALTPNASFACENLIAAQSQNEPLLTLDTTKYIDQFLQVIYTAMANDNNPDPNTPPHNQIPQGSTL